MQLGSKFQEYNVQKASQVACRLQPQYESYLGIAQAHAKVLDTAVAELEAKADTTHKQKADGEAFRGEQFCHNILECGIVIRELASSAICCCCLCLCQAQAVHSYCKRLVDDQQLTCMLHAAKIADGHTSKLSYLFGAERKLAEMEGAMQVVHQEIGGLEEQQAELLRQLKLVQDQIAAAKAKRV